VTRRLALRGHHVRVVTPRPGGPLPGPTPADLITYPVSRRTPFETFFTNALLSRIAVSRELRRRPADVVMLSSYEVAFGHYVRRRTPDVPSVFTYHSSFFSDAVNRLARERWPLRLAHRPLRAFMRGVERMTFRSATRIVAVSPFSRAEIEERLGHGDARIRVIPTGVDTAVFRPGDRAASRARLGLPPDARILLTVGRLSRVKRYDRALEALRLLSSEDPRYLLVIAGTGPEERSLRATATELGPATRFAGFVDGEVLRDHYRAADLTLCTSDFENWSLAILESLACGTPVVGTPRGSIPDLLGLVDPSLVAAGVEPRAIAARIAEHFARPDRLAALRERSTAVVARGFSWERTIDRLESCLAEAVGAAAP
jgi:glycosyltransferase involved in cell wall biosynthesis